MTEIEVETKLRNIFSDILGIEPEMVKRNSRQEDILEWDSLGHLRLIMTIEEEFSVKFSMNEIPRYKSIDSFITEILNQKNG